MRTRILLLFILLPFWGFSQDKAFDGLKDKTQTNILYDRVFSVSNAVNPKTENVSSLYFMQVYSELQKADFQNRLPAVETLKKAADTGFSEDIIPLSLLISDFESVKTSAFETGKISRDANHNFVLKADSDDIFEKHQINLFAALLSKTKSGSPVFVLKKDLIFNTSQRQVSSIEILDNGIWKTIIEEVPFQLNFSSNGKKTIEYKIKFSDGKEVLQSFSLNVQHQQRASGKNSGQFSPGTVHSISSSIPYQGYGETQAYPGQGEYEIFLDTVNGVLDKPIILVDGFDPGDSRNTEAIYQMLNYGSSGQNLGDIVRAEGYDVIVLNFPQYTRTGTSTIIDGGVDYIQRNAMILVELLNLINSQKTGNEKNVVIGPSMGGLISRYALRYMEQNSMNHDTRLYLSFDSPHLGANVPIGFQHLFNYMGYGPLGDLTMQTLVDGMLKSPAAREMLLDHFEGHLQSGSTYDFDTNITLPTGCPNYRSVFQNELDTMGFPQNTRNIAIINGAGNATANGTPGMEVMNHTFNTSSTQRAIININYTPAANQTKEVSHFKGQQWILWWITFYESAASSRSPVYTAGLDTSPGGRFDLTGFADAAEGNALFEEFMDNLAIGYFSFIPALSAMAITGTNNYYANLSGGMNTPFAAYSMPVQNENHVTLQTQNVQFALNEILNDETLAAQNIENDAVRIENPVKDVLRIKTSAMLKDAVISITDMSGKTVFTKSGMNMNGITEIPVRLEKGIYILNIVSEKKNIVQKITKE